MVMPERMNVLYIGVDNPISIGVAGISSANIKVIVEDGGAKIKKISGGKYSVKAMEPTARAEYCTIKIMDVAKNRIVASFRIKRIPDPIAKLTNNKRGGTLRPEEMRAQRGLMAILENFDFDARCSITGFTLYHQPAGASSAQKSVNQGGVFRGTTLQLIQQAKPGDSYQFMDIKTRCPGDKASKDIGSMVFRIQ